MKSMQLALYLFHQSIVIIIEHCLLLFQSSIIRQLSEIQILSWESLSVDQSLVKSLDLVNCLDFSIQTHNLAFNLIFPLDKLFELFLHYLKSNNFQIFVIIIRKNNNHKQIQVSMLQLRYKYQKSVINYEFGRVKKKNPFLIKERRYRTFRDLYQYAYKNPFNEHEDLMYCQTVYGKNCYIVGLTPNSQSSSIFVNSAILTMNPTHLVLGNFNNSIFQNIYPFVQTLKIQNQLSLKYDQKFTPKDLFCRSSLAPLVYHNTSFNSNWHVDQKNNVIYMADHPNTRITTNDYLTAINVISQKQNIRLSFGIPSDTIRFEDIMLYSDLNKMREAFRNILQRVRKNATKQDTKFSYGSCQIVEEIQLEAQKQPILFQKELTYMASLLNTYSSVSQTVMMLVSKNFVSHIADNVHKISIAPQKVYRNYLHNEQSEGYNRLAYYLSSQNRQQKIDELLQKFAILNICKNNLLEIELVLKRKNVFLNTIFKPLFQNLNIDEIIQRYRKIKSPLKSQFFQLISKRLENIREQYQQQNLFTMNLMQQLKMQQQRAIDYPYTFLPMNKLIVHKKCEFLNKLQQKMKELIEFKTQQQKQLFKLHMQGKRTKQGIIMFTKLLGEARLALIEEDPQFKKMALSDIGKLPIYHFQAFRHFFKEQLIQYTVNKNKKKNVIESIKQKLQQENNTKFINVNSMEEAEKYIKQQISANDQGQKMKLRLNEEGQLQIDQQQEGKTVDQLFKDLANKPFFKEIMNDLEKQMKKETQEQSDLYKDFVKEPESISKRQKNRNKRQNS